MEREFYLGRTIRHEHVYATVSIVNPNRESVEFTDHSIGAAPIRVSVSFVLLSKYATLKADHYRLSDVPDGYWLGFGQVPEDERIIIGKSTRAIPAEDRQFIELLWRDWHLNDMHAECIHQADKYSADCPETGYRYGSKWLAEAVPQDILDRAIALVQ